MRADKFLVHHNYFESRTKAQAAIEAGLVSADGHRVEKSSQKLTSGMRIEAEAPHPWVSRAGIKLAHGLEAFNIDPRGRICLDVGASTGGFTHVLKSRGARKIYAVDVGREQLHASLRNDPVIISAEQTDARQLTAAMLSPPPSLIVCDVSFISCMKALETPLSLATQNAELLTLVKPQFEVGKAGIGKGGIVRDPTLAAKVLHDVQVWLEAQGWDVKGDIVSPIKGGDGNMEYLLYGEKTG